MGGFDYRKIEHLLNEHYKIAVETGSFLGEGTEFLSYIFEKVYTIEIDENLFNNVTQKFKDIEKIVCLQGDSKEYIAKLSRDLSKLDSNVLFWLDAHWSGDDTVDWEQSIWKGYRINTGYSGEKVIGVPTSYNQVPLEQEIINIYWNFKNECIILIDDFDKIDPNTLKGLKNKCFSGEDYSHLDFRKIFSYIDDRIVFKEITGNQCILKLKKIEI